MRSTTLNFSKSYFGYLFRRSLPYTVIMTVILLAINICVFSLAADYRPDDCLNLIDISIPTLIMMYVFPVILGCWHFKFLFTHNGSDFYGSMPLTRAALFNTNFLCGITSILIIIAVNTVYFVAVFPFSLANGVLIAPVMYLWYFLTWFVSYAAVFAVMAFAATLSGTLPAQLILSYVIAFVPGFIVTAFQSFIIENLYVRNISTEITAFSADSLIKVLFAPYYTVQQLFSLVCGGSEYIGSFYDIQTLMYFAVNAVAVLLFLFLGGKLLRRRRFETAGTAYVNDRLYDSVKILSIFPFMYFLLKEFIEGFEFSLFILLFVLVTVFYVVLDLFLRKGLARVGKSAIVFVCSIAFAATVLLLAGGNELLTSNRTVYSRNADIKSVTVYLRPAGLTPVSSMMTAPYNKERIALTFSDEELINCMLDFDPETYKGSSEKVFLRLKVNNRSIAGKYNVSDKFINRLYELINENDEYCAALDYTSRRKASLTSATVSLRAYSDYGYYETSDSFSVPDGSFGELLGLLDASNSRRSLTSRLSNATGVSENYNSFGYSYYYNDAEPKNEEYTDPYTSIYIDFNSYINGMYYRERFYIDEESYQAATEAVNTASSSAMKKAFGTVADGKRLYFSVASCADLKETVTDNVYMIKALAEMYPEELYAIACEAKGVNSSDDTLLLRISNDMTGYSFLLSYSESVKPLFERYMEECLAFAEDFSSQYDSISTLNISVLIDGELSVYDSPVYYQGNSLKNLFTEIAGVCTETPSLYTTGGQQLQSVAGQDIITLSVLTKDKRVYTLFGIMNDGLWNKLAEEDSVNGGVLDGMMKIDSAEYSRLIIDGIEITQADDIAYFKKALSAMYSYSYNGKYETQCFAYDMNGAMTEYYIPLTHAMQARLKSISPEKAEVK